MCLSSGQMLRKSAKALPKDARRVPSLRGPVAEMRSPDKAASVSAPDASASSQPDLSATLEQLFQSSEDAPGQSSVSHMPVVQALPSADESIDIDIDIDIDIHTSQVPTTPVPTELFSELLDALEESQQADQGLANFNADNPTQDGWHLAEDVALELLTPGRTMANNINECLKQLDSLDGFVGAALANSESGMALGKHSVANFNLDVAAAVNSEVVKAKYKAIRSLKLNDKIEDILISLGTQYHLLRPTRPRPNLFFYLVLDRRSSNLALARMALEDAETNLSI